MDCSSSFSSSDFEALDDRDSAGSERDRAFRFRRREALISFPNFNFNFSSLKNMPAFLDGCRKRLEGDPVGSAYSSIYICRNIGRRNQLGTYVGIPRKKMSTTSSLFQIGNSLSTKKKLGNKLTEFWYVLSSFFLKSKSCRVFISTSYSLR